MTVFHFLDEMCMRPLRKKYLLTLSVVMISFRISAQIHSLAAVPSANNFAYPQSLFIDSQNGHVWVADFDNHRIVRFDVSTLTMASEKHASLLPEKYELDQNFPNPFNPATQIKFTLPLRGFTSLKIFDLLGKEVATLLSQSHESGSYTVSFDASRLRSGVYFYTLRSGTFVQTKRMVFLK